MGFALIIASAFAWLICTVVFGAASATPNLPGWVFFATLPFGAAVIAKVAAWRLDRRAD